jgi:hypothetical protein
MERFSPIFLIAGVITFLLGFFLQGALPMITLKDVPVQGVAELAQRPPLEFYQLAEDYPAEFARHYGQPGPESFARAIQLGKEVYIAEACWHCHSQYVRPVSREDLRFGPVSTAAEYTNDMNLPHLFGTRRVGPDLIRIGGKRSNDWHAAHFYDPRSVAPYSVMPTYPWLFDEERRPNEKGLALIAYMQWLGSWVPREETETIYNAGTIPPGQGGAP